MRLRLTFGIVTALCTATLAAACGGSTAVTEVSGPGVVRCQTGVSAPPTSFPASGNRVTLTVLAARECTWTAVSEASWAQVSPASGQGEGAITVTVASNPDPRVRTGALVVNDNRLSLTQEAAPCRFDVAPVTIRLSHEGGRTGVEVSTLAGCTWRATSNQSWARVLTDSGTSSGTVEIDVSRNDTPSTRGATITVAGQAVTIHQAAVGDGPAPPGNPGNPPGNPGNPGNSTCAGTIEPDSRSFGSGADDGTIGVIVVPTCAWEATTTAGWITIRVSSGTGPGLVRYRVDANNSNSERTGAITVAGRTHTVRQAGAAPPAPQQPREVEFRGTATDVIGVCPVVMFSAAGYSVFTDGDTRWKGEGCRDLKSGRRVKVHGSLVADRRVRATRVDVDDDD